MQPGAFGVGVLPWSSSSQFLVGHVVTKREEPGRAAEMTVTFFFFFNGETLLLQQQHLREEQLIEKYGRSSKEKKKRCEIGQPPTFYLQNHQIKQTLGKT